MSTVRPTYIANFVDSVMNPAPLRSHDLYNSILADLVSNVPWTRKEGSPRDECFMSDDPGLVYSYGSQARGRTYSPVPMHPIVRGIMEAINRIRGCRYNVCVLNHYPDGHSHLGWHRDDSPEQDPGHPIAVVSFTNPGSERELWVRENGQKGAVPPEDRFLLGAGSLFEMPVGYQDTHQHRVPKADRPCGPRVSLTYRKLDRTFVAPTT